ncbi:hypothetical protein LCGC14_2204910 [marine sediment metagenome]|uniref:Uncharacterized protein n=1 Tax=marine sediment metagenome TaxID=412755 RepID=A0A0F9GBB5_9ZZZZ
MVWTHIIYTTGPVAFILGMFVVYYLAESVILELWGLKQGYDEHMWDMYRNDPSGAFWVTVLAPVILIYLVKDLEEESESKK